MAVVCNVNWSKYPSGDVPDNFIVREQCIQCRYGNLSCFLGNKVIQDDFDYLVAFSTSDDIQRYVIQDSSAPLIFSNDDVIVYKLNSVQD